MSPAPLLFSPRDRAVCRPLARIAVGNPFSPSRIEDERECLGDAFVNPGRSISPGADPLVTHENIRLLTALVGRTLPPIQARYAAGAAASKEDRALYISVCFYFLYDSFDTQLSTLIGGRALKAPFYKQFLAAYRRCFGFLGKAPDIPEPAHMFAVLFQIRRAFHFLYVNVRGSSLPIAGLRAQIWDAIFGGPLDEYGLYLWNRMARFSTLIQGPTGTGKELAAKAIAQAGYVPFNPKTSSFAPHANYYGAINLLSLAPALLESELFGHVKGSFTGAERDKKGLLETVPGFGAVLLDEVAEIKPRLQIKLLRVLQERTFRYVGDEQGEHSFHARILTATHRDPAERMEKGRLREDFFRRICMLKIVTPSLRERLDDSPGELRELVTFIATDLYGPELAGPLTDKVEAVVEKRLGSHPWTGNMRELLQCVCDVKRSGTYVPTKTRSQGPLEHALARSKLPLDEIVRRHAVSTFERTGSLPETARQLEISVRRLQRILANEPVAAVNA